MAKFRKKPNLSRRNDPDDDWNVPDPVLPDCIVQCERIVEKIKHAPGAAQARSFQFLEDIRQKVDEIRLTMLDTNRVSPGQAKALKGWEAGIDKCLEKYRPSAAAEKEVTDG